MTVKTLSTRSVCPQLRVVDSTLDARPSGDSVMLNPKKKANRDERSVLRWPHVYGALKMPSFSPTLARYQIA
jgi:hypothetical protein